MEAVMGAIGTCGNPGRGAHTLAMRAAEEVFACRSAAAELFGAAPERVIFTSGATHSLNMAINAHKSRRGAILISDLEHNAVRRPAVATGKEIRVFSSALHLTGVERTIKILSSIDALSRGADMLVCTAASNICGADMPIADIGSYCRSKGILFIVDAAQAGGIYDINVDESHIDVLCLSGHKGLYGPMGCGMMILGAGVTIPPFIYGGSGVDSRLEAMPTLPPERFEAGTLPLPAIAGLRRGIEVVKSRTPTAIRRREEQLARRLKSALSHMNVRVYASEQNGGIVLFNVDGVPAEVTASMLNELGICVRAGLHCAPLAHDTLGSDGAVRVSFGMYNTESEVDSLARAVKTIICKIGAN